MAEAHAQEGRLWVARYRLIKRIGSGGQGTVYQANDERLGRPVAIKFPKINLLADPRAAERFRREARALAKLRHPNILAVHDFGEHKGQPYLVTDWLVGKTLDEALRTRRWTPDQAADLVEKIARALEFVHQHGLLHRDLKPSNIFLEESGNPLIMDFGLAREIGGKADISRTGDLLGTPGFVSPEQASGVGEALDARSDVYSLGVILYALLARRLPFQGSPLAIIRASAERDAPPPGTHRPGIPLELQAICLQALARDPGRRFSGAGAFADALAKRAATPSFVREVRRRRLWLKLRAFVGQRSPWWLAAVAGAATALAWLVWPREEPRRTVPTPPEIIEIPAAKDERPAKVGSDRPPAGEFGRREFGEIVGVGRAEFAARIRLTGLRANLMARADDPADGWIVGELSLFAAGTPADRPTETFRLVWARHGRAWYCDGLTFRLTLLEPLLRTLPAAERARVLDEALVQVRGAAPAARLVFFSGERRGDLPCAAVRGWLKSPSLAGHDATRSDPAAAPVDFPAAREPLSDIAAGAVDSSDLGPMLAGLGGRLADLAEAMWQTGERPARSSAVRMLAALANSAGFGAAAADLRARARPKLRDLFPAAAMHMPPAELMALLGAGTEGELYRALRPSAESAAVWEDFTARTLRAAEARRATDAKSADDVTTWVIDCFGGAGDVSTPSARAAREKRDGH